ncbi:MAG: MBL fold metallo-hydrolase [Chlamydiia bacterium]
MEIIDKILGPAETRTLLLICPETNETVVVDPSFYSFHHFSPIIRDRGLTLKMVWLTHSHWDHIADIAKFHDLGAPVFVHPLDQGNVIAPGSDGLRAPKVIESVREPKNFQEGDTLRFGSCHCLVMETPGHSPGSVCFYFPKEEILLSGDTLFRGAIGRLDLPTSRPELMRGSLNKLNLLPENTLVYPGHGPTTTIREEL